MLRPEYLAGLPDPILELYEQAELDILRNMAERISRYDYWIPAADWQNLKLKEAGRMQEEILRILARYSGKTEAELRALMEKAAAEGLRSDRSVYEAHGETVPPFSDSEVLVNTLNAGYRATRQTMRNLTRTTATTATRQFERALDRAWLQVRSGAMSYDQAVIGAVKDLAERGVESIRYPSGRTDTIETAVRRAVVTGINQTTLQLQDQLAEEMDCDLVEVSAHAGARPSHAVWQGKIYSRSGESKKYPKLSTATGYGTGEGLGGWNCGHNMYPWYEGSPRAYSEEQLAQYNAKTVTYNGEKMTEYEASQIQRKIERNIRKWKREYAALEAAGQDAGPAAAKLKAWRERERDFLAQTGLKKQSARSQVAGFGRGQAGRATAAGKKMDERKKALAFIQNDSKIKAASGLPSRLHGLPDEKLAYTLNVDIEKSRKMPDGFHGVAPKGANLTEVSVMAGYGTSTPIRDLPRLYATYPNMDPRLWTKKTGTAYGAEYHYQVHWYENSGTIPPEEIKLKGMKKNK